MLRFPVFALTLISIAHAAEAPVKKRIAVLDFDNPAAPATPYAAIYQARGANTGRTVADLLVNRFVQDSACSVIERKAIDKLLSEQNLSNSDRADPVTAARLGRVLGVDAIILGSITRYDREDKVTGGGGGMAMPQFGVRRSTSTKHDIQAHVQISARVVSSDTAEVLAVAQGTGECIRKGVKSNSNGGMIAVLGGGAPGNDGTINEAMDKAIAQLAGQLETSFPKLPVHQASIDGVVADANAAGRLVLNVGAKNGLKVGDRLQVWRTGKVITDPDTGKVLLRDGTLLGEATLTTVNDISSLANYAGAEAAKQGDRVKNFPKK